MWPFCLMEAQMPHLMTPVQVSMMPRCTSVGAVLKAGSPLEGLQLFVAAGWEAVGTIFTESFVSLVCGVGTVSFLPHL